MASNARQYLGPQCPLASRGNQQAPAKRTPSKFAAFANTVPSSGSPPAVAPVSRGLSQAVSVQASPSWRQQQPHGQNAAPSRTAVGPRPLNSPPKSFACSNWRANAAPLSSKPSKPALSSVRPGMVFHLKRPTDMTTASPEVQKLDSLRSENQHVFEHPVVILETNESRRTVKFRLCTTFGSKSKVPVDKSPASRSRIALCDSENGAAEHDGTRKLTMETGSERFKKATWINFYGGAESELWIDYASLELWSTNSGNIMMFDDESVKRIKARNPF